MTLGQGRGWDVLLSSLFPWDLGTPLGLQGICRAPSYFGWSMGRGRRQQGVVGAEQTTGPQCSSAHNGSLHLQGVPVCPTAPSMSHCPITLGVSLTPPFSPGQSRCVPNTPFTPGQAPQYRGESPACETCGPGSACLGEQHGDTCNPTRAPGAPWVSPEP